VSKPRSYVVPKEGTVSLHDGSRRLSFNVSNVSDEARKQSYVTAATWLRRMAAWCDEMAAAKLVAEDEA